MAQQLQDWRSRHGSEAVWLASLVESFDRISRDGDAGARCDDALIRAARAQLSLPLRLRRGNRSN